MTDVMLISEQQDMAWEKLSTILKVKKQENEAC